MADTSTLFSTVKNPLSGTRTYGYLGYHGRTLPSLSEFTWFGDFVSYMAKGTPTHKRWTDALQRDLLAGNIVIITMPRPILKDASTKAIKALNLSGGTLGVVDPSWGAYTDTVVNPAPSYV